MRKVIVFLGMASLAAPLHSKVETSDRDENSEEIICKYQKVLGSRIPEKICLSRFEWDERNRIQKENSRSNRNNHSSADLPSQP